MLVTTQLLYTGKSTIMLQYCIQVFHSSEHITLLNRFKNIKIAFQTKLYSQFTNKTLQNRLILNPGSQI